MTIFDKLEAIPCACERQDVLAAAIPDRHGLVAALDLAGFGRPGQAVPTDWRTYYGDDELHGFILDCADQIAPAT